MGFKNIKEIKDIRSILIKIKRGEQPKPSSGRNILLRRGAIDFKPTGKKFGEGKLVLTGKGKRLLAASKLVLR